MSQPEENYQQADLSGTNVAEEARAPQCTLQVPMSDVLHAIGTRTWYKGEGVKAQDVNAYLTQTSSEEAEELKDYARTAANRVYVLMSTKMPGLKLEASDEAITYTFDDIVKENALGVMERAVRDYIVNWCLYMWYDTTRPELSQKYEEKVAYYEAEVIRSTNHLRKLVRRRYVWF